MILCFLKKIFHVELKREFTKNIKKEVVAFANSEGGTLYLDLGIDDNGLPVGVDGAEEVSLQLMNIF